MQCVNQKLRKNRTRRSLRIRDIAITDDHTFDKDFYKSNRRVIVSEIRGEIMTVNKIHTISGKEDKVSRGTLYPLKDKYKCLPKKSAVSVYSKRVDGDKHPLKVNDSRFIKTSGKITARDFNQFNRARKKYFKNK